MNELTPSGLTLDEIAIARRYGASVEDYAASKRLLSAESLTPVTLTEEEVALAVRTGISLEAFARVRRKIEQQRREAREQADRMTTYFKERYPEAYQEKEGEQDNG